MPRVLGIPLHQRVGELSGGRAVALLGGLAFAVVARLVWTRAVREGNSWVLNGVKRWITSAGVSEYYTVLAMTDPEPRHWPHVRATVKKPC